MDILHLDDSPPWFTLNVTCTKTIVGGNYLKIYLLDKNGDAIDYSDENIEKENIALRFDDSRVYYNSILENMMPERNAVFDHLRPKLNYKLSVAVAVYNDNVRIRIQTDSSENWQEIIAFLDDQVEENNQLSLKNRAENKEDEGIVHDYGLVKMNNDGFTYFFDLGSTNDAFFDYILLSLNKYKNIVKAKIY